MVTGGNGRMIMLIRLTTATLVTLAILVGSIFILSVYPFHPIVYGQIVLNQNTVQVGKYMSYTANFVKNTYTVGTMTRYLISTKDKRATITLGPGGLADAQVTDKSKTVSVEIPEFVAEGEYFIRWVVVYPYFGIRQISATCETPPFMVTK